VSSGGSDEDDDWPGWLARHGAALVLFARQWASSRPDAEDVVQDGFVRFWRSRERANDPVAYLYACVRASALDRARSSHRRWKRETETAQRQGAAGVDLLACPLEQDERRAAIEAALARLPESQREVLVMKIWGGLSFPQIAAALDVPPDTAASRYRYAIAKLREQLAEEPTSHG
jgi:RNA polymerase sigma-70 factor (ECF subfamily)